MKDYNEMAKSVFEKRDEYLIAQKRRRGMLLKAGVPICSLVLVTMVSLLLWQAKLPELPVKEPQTNQTEQTEPYATEDNSVKSTEEKPEATRHSVLAQQSLAHSVSDRENIPKPTQITQENIGDKPQNQGGKPLAPEASKPQSEQTVPVPETGGIAYPNSPEASGKPSHPDIPSWDNETPFVTDSPSVDWEDPPDWIPEWTEQAPLPTDPAINCTTDSDYIPQPNTTGGESCVTTLPTEPVPTGPLEITVADKTYTAQVGDKVTYTVELQAAERFEDIQLKLLFGKDYLEAIVPKDSDGETDYMEITPNLPSSFVGCFDGRINMNASRVSKFDFRDKKVLMTMEFMVTYPGKTQITRQMEEMYIYSNYIDGGWVDGNWQDGYWDRRSYFGGGSESIVEGIFFEEYLTITPAADIVPPDTEEKPVEVVPEFVYPEESTDGDLLVYCDNRVYAADIGQRITYIVELEAAERFEHFFVHLQYDDKKLDMLSPEYESEDDIAPQLITLPNISNAIVNYNFHKEPHVVASGVWIGKYDFKARKVFIQLEFIVKSEGEVNMDFWVEDMQISDYRQYFFKNEPVITEGIKFYEYIIVN